MRRFARRVTTTVPTATAALLLLAAPALAAPHAGHGQPARHAVTHKAHKDHPKKHVHDITLVGTISDTPTATIGSTPSDTSTVTLAPPSDTATSTITIVVKGGDRAHHRQVVTLLLDKHTVVRRGDRTATAADLRRGDHVSVRARKQADGSWLALRVNAAGKHD